MARIDDEIVDLLAAGGLGLTKATNVFSGPLRGIDSNIPAKAVFVLSSGGPSPDFYCGDAHHVNKPSVQILVRGAVEDLSDAQNLADACYALLVKTKPATALGVLGIESAPNYLGKDTDGHHMFSFNLRGWKRSDT
jgi:hypothetical protein